MALLRSNVEFAKRVFLDRLTTDAQGLAQPNDIDMGPGELYEYGGTYDGCNFGVGADCSGAVGIVCAAAFNGPSMGWQRYFSTETFPNGFDGFRQVSQNDCVTGDYPFKVMICHGGGGPDSHMACQLDGWDCESNGDYGTCTAPGEITGLASDYWNDWWVLDGPITEDTDFRQPMGYPRGLDYAGGRPSGADLKAAGISFVCRYLSDGGPNLPGKQLQPGEAADLMANGIEIVANWETAADAMLNGYDQGKSDAQAARDWIVACGGPRDATVYFSADWDEAENQQTTVNQYLQACCDVLGGPDRVGIYGAYYVGMRALNAGVAHYLWQTQAWSGGNVDARVSIVQRNNLGYQSVGGVQCDINEQHSDDMGQWSTSANTPPPQAPVPDDGPLNYTVLTYEQLMGVRGVDGFGHGWAQLGGRSVVDALAAIGEQLKINGFTTQ